MSDSHNTYANVLKRVMEMKNNSLKPQGYCLLSCLCKYDLSNPQVPVTMSGELQSVMELMEFNLLNIKAKPWRG